ncbi:hypothetical protein T01_2742 [Trichinella spiralis]|uniref:Lipoprotein n=1 Tax=Trichinella spiralis TaxID=6334 RepID=A0A0V1AKB8_TRISP|nr:hypothetical protein T01_2742 [Trichinella spiralis]
MTEFRLNGLAIHFYCLINFLLVNCASTARDFTGQGNQSCDILNIS